MTDKLVEKIDLLPYLRILLEPVLSNPDIPIVEIEPDAELPKMIEGKAGGRQ